MCADCRLASAREVRRRQNLRRQEASAARRLRSAAAPSAAPEPRAVNLRQSRAEIAEQVERMAAHDSWYALPERRP